MYIALIVDIPTYAADIAVLPTFAGILISLVVLYTLYTHTFYMLFTNLTKLIRKCDNSLLLSNLNRLMSLYMAIIGK